MAGLTHFIDDAAVLAAIATLQSILEAGSSTFSGTVYYVDSVGGDDLNDGLTPLDAFATIGAGIAATVAGDAISVKTGSYDEDGLELALDGVELWADLGVVLSNTAPGTCLTVSGDYCRVRLAGAAQAGQVCFNVTGSHCVFEDCNARASTVGYDISGSANLFEGCRAGNYTVDGWVISGNGNIIQDSMATGNDGATHGFYISAGTKNRLVRCVSNNNATAGFETEAVVTDGMFIDCVSGSADSKRIDGGYKNTWPGFEDKPRREKHEHIYPPPAGEGVASNPVLITSEATDDSGAGPWTDQDYWGDVVIIVPPDTLTEFWLSLGIYIHAETAADNQTWQIMYPIDRYSASRDGGNDWDYQETVLTVDDSTYIEVGDKLWITGTGQLSGEIVNVADVTGNVVTISSETRISADTGLKFDYTGAEKMYVIYRESERSLHGYEGAYSGATTKSFNRFNWSEPKLIDANGGMIMRMLNATDDAVSNMSVRAIFTD